MLCCFGFIYFAITSKYNFTPAVFWDVHFFYLSTAKDPKKIKRERISVHGFYRIGKVIGDGNFAVVRECKNRYVFLFIENVNKDDYICTALFQYANGINFPKHPGLTFICLNK